MNQPKDIEVSIVMPCLNEEESIRRVHPDGPAKGSSGPAPPARS